MTGAVSFGVVLVVAGLAPRVGIVALSLIGLFNVPGTYTAGWAGARVSKTRLLAGEGEEAGREGRETAGRRGAWHSMCVKKSVDERVEKHWMSGTGCRCVSEHT